MKKIGGGLYSNLTTLSPRLPRGKSNIDVNKLLEIKKPRKPRPKESSLTVDQVLNKYWKVPIDINTID